MLQHGSYSFNLGHPVSPYIGDVANARVVILGANAGYKQDLTPTEFPSDEAVADYVSRVDDPSAADWTFVSCYYDSTNYGNFLADRRAVLVNACAYRSPKLSQEPDNRAIMRRLPSVAFTRRWLLEAVLPRAEKGERLIIAKRHGQWKLPPSFFEAVGVAVDRAPVSPQITGDAYTRMMSFLGDG